MHLVGVVLYARLAIYSLSGPSCFSYANLKSGEGESPKIIGGVLVMISIAFVSGWLTCHLPPHHILNAAW